MEHKSIIWTPVHDGNTIKAMLADIKRRGDKLSEHIIVASQSVMLHAIVHGDANYATLLCSSNTLHGAIDRKDAIGKWLQAFGPLVWSAETKGFKIKPDIRKKLKQRYDENPEDFIINFFAEVGTFDRFSPPKPVQAFNIMDQVHRAILQAMKIKAGEKESDPNKTNLTGLDMLVDAVAAIDRAVGHKTIIDELRDKGLEKIVPEPEIVEPEVKIA